MFALARSLARHTRVESPRFRRHASEFELRAPFRNCLANVAPAPLVHRRRATPVSARALASRVSPAVVSRAHQPGGDRGVAAHTRHAAAATMSRRACVSPRGERASTRPRRPATRAHARERACVRGDAARTTVCTDARLPAHPVGRGATVVGCSSDEFAAARREAMSLVALTATSLCVPRARSSESLLRRRRRASRPTHGRCSSFICGRLLVASAGLCTCLRRPRWAPA